MLNLNNYHVKKFAFQIFIAVITISIIPIYGWYSTGKRDYALMSNGQKTEGIVIRRSSLKHDGLLPFDEFSKYKTFTLAYKIKDGSSQTLTTNIFKDTATKEFDKPLPFSIGITFDRNEPASSELARYVPKDFNALLLNWVHFILFEIMVILFAIIFLNSSYQIYKNRYTY